MGSFERIAERLPTIYRPEAKGGDELSKILVAAAFLLDLAREETTAILQTHWFRYADQARFQPWFLRTRELEHLPLPAPTDPAVQLFPYIHDLGRLAALFGILPWQAGVAYRESVEAFRKRINRLVRMFASGLGTVHALRAVVEASLPLHEESGLPLVDLPFTVEELPAVTVRVNKVAESEIPEEMLGPLRRWTVSNQGSHPAALTVYLSGVSPEPDKTGPTEAPVIELYSAHAITHPVGLAFNGTVAPDKTLRLRPAYYSFAGSAAGVLLAASAPAKDLPASPAPMVPWSSVDPGPDKSVAALCRTADNKLYAAVNDQDGDPEVSGRIWAYDGAQWTLLKDILPRIFDLAEEGESLAIATASGLKSLALYADGHEDRLTDIPLGESLLVHAIHACDQALWLGTSKGAWRLDQGFGVQKKMFPFAQVYAIAHDDRGATFFGANVGVFQYHPSTDDCFLFQGGGRSETVSDWIRVDPEATALPGQTAQLFLPDVRAIRRSADGWLWIGTAAGIARWGACAVVNNVYTTTLAAFPLLGTGTVFAIEEDERGRVWFCTEQGLIVHDGRDFYQISGAECRRLIAADDDQAGQLSGKGIWRFDGASGWQRYNEKTGQWSEENGARLTSEARAVFNVAWADGLAADLGVWDGIFFTAEQEIPATEFTVRFKQNRRRIVDGGLPALPRLPRDDSVWRYLMQESWSWPSSEPKQQWSCEGRQLFGDQDLPDPEPARFLDKNKPQAVFGNMVHAFLPNARLTMAWQEQTPCSVLVRLVPGEDEALIDSVVTDRLWQALNLVRPAGIRIFLAINETIVRGT